MYFNNSPYTVETLKKEFRTLANQLHPDHGGNEEEFKAMMAEYSRLLASLDGGNKYTNNDTTADYMRRKWAEHQAKQAAEREEAERERRAEEAARRAEAAQEAEQRRQEEEAAEQFVEETKEMLKYKSDCDQLRPYMVADLSSYELSDRRGRQSGRRRNILSVLRHYFPGVKFSVKYRWASHTELEVEWTDGPTRKEVESVCNWSIFCDTWESFDGMTDSTSRGSMKYTEFAQQYGGGFLDGISFDRSNSPEVINECREYARSIFEACGLDTARDYHETSTEGMKIYNACPYLNGSGYYWYSVNSLAEIVAAKLSHFAA